MQSIANADPHVTPRRNIPAYDLYLQQAAIVELHWSAIKLKEPQIRGSFQPRRSGR